MNLQLDTFRNIDEGFHQDIEKHGSIISFKKMDELFNYDDVLQYFYIILSGKVKISQINFKNNKEQTIYLLSRGDMYDVVTLLDGEVHNVLAEVLEEGSVLRVPISKAREWMYDYPLFGEMILKYISKQIRKVEELATDLTLFDTQERLIKLIIQSVDPLDSSAKNILDGLSHAEIANLIGTVRHVVDRHIKQLKSDEILENKRRRISLKNKEKLLDRIKNIF